MNVINFLTTIWILYKINFQQLLTQNIYIKKKSVYSKKKKKTQQENVLWLFYQKDLLVLKLTS